MLKYWQKRFEFLENQRNKVAIDTVQSITPAFNEAQAKIEKEINAWYGRFAKNNQISLQEAKKLLNTKELKEFHWDVQEYIKYGRQNAIDQKWMKELENASARFHISRLEALKIHTQNAAERAFGNELDQLDEMAARIYMDDYYHTAYEIQKGLGVGFDVSKIDQRKLDSIVSKPWTTDKMTFSDRIWKAKTQLLDSLHTELTQMCILGKEPDEVIRNISQRMGVSKGQAGRLVMTEAAYFGSVAQKDCFNDLDVEKYEVIATLDNRTSEVCRKMDGQVFDMKDYQAGVTAPPFHCWCRSCTAPWFEDNDDGTRVARDADGKIYEVPASMKYEDWKQCFVDKTKDPADWLKLATAEDVIEAVDVFEKVKKIHLGSLNTKNFDELSQYMKDKYSVVLTKKVQSLDFESVRDSVSGIEWTLQNFPETKGYLKKIDSNKKGGVMNSTGDVIACSPVAFDGHYYSGDHEFFRSTGVHEATHMVEGYLIDKTATGTKEFAEMWNNHSISKSIVKEAVDNLPSSMTEGKKHWEIYRTISSYASINTSECMAEAMSDIYKHGDSASKLSIEIFKILKKRMISN